MLNKVWIGMLLTGFITGLINGRIKEVTNAIFEGAGKAVTLSVALLGVVCLWSGMMAIAEKNGLLKLITFIFRPILKLLFKRLPFEHNAFGAIIMNMAANFLGLGNAATPLGLKAMSELQKLNNKKDTASDEMCLFLVLNTAAFQLVPANVIALRVAAGSSNPQGIISAVWIASAFSMIVGIAAAKIFSKLLFYKASQYDLRKYRGR